MARPAGSILSLHQTGYSFYGLAECVVISAAMLIAEPVASAEVVVVVRLPVTERMPKLSHTHALCHDFRLHRSKSLLEPHCGCGERWPPDVGDA